MTSSSISWSNANQQYLSGMIKLLLKRIGHQLLVAGNNGEDHVLPDLSNDENELQSLAASMPDQPAIEKLSTTLGLSVFEKNVLLMCAAPELNPDVAGLIENIPGEGESFQPSLGLALAALPGAHWSAISPASPLRYWRLIEVNRTQLLTRSPIKIDEHILHYVAGVPGLHDKLAEVAELFVSNEEPVSSQMKTAEKIIQCITDSYSGRARPVIQLYGNDRFDKLELAAYIGSRFGSSLYTISAYALPVSSRELTELTRLWSREAALNNYLLFLDASGLDINDKQRTQSVLGFIENMQGIVILNADNWSPELKRNKLVFDIEKPSSDEQMQLWQTMIGSNGNVQLTGLEKIISQFNLSSGTIRKAGIEVAALLSLNGIDEAATNHIQQNVWKICCRHTRPQVDELAQRIEPVATWNDIVLPEAQKNMLKEIAAQVKHRNKVYNEWGFASKGIRGLGISALFAGESGTGKTMASEVLAHELGLDLYKIDLSKVVNKYIGETEKNLKKIFDAAEEGGAILLFDEADALFGKRSDVKDSHDRYSNIEISYLLQRMEAYRGLAILTTNMKSALDKAFMRRIRFILQFQFPDSAMRAEIWSKVFPGITPVEELDLEKLSRLSIAGGSIRNIAMNAAFIAADEKKAVQMSHIFRAARSEYDKTEKALNSAEFKGW